MYTTQLSVVVGCRIAFQQAIKENVKRPKTYKRPIKKQKFGSLRTLDLSLLSSRAEKATILKCKARQKKKEKKER